ncbi:MAG: DsbA family protein [Bilifractor sp.]|jgi:protein-disulfide isomerase-like protein with CxxC motif
MKNTNEKNNTKLEVMVFTDPYCSWCWATEPMILTMMEKYRDQLHFRYVFGGLIKDFDDFYDAQNDIRDAAATKPHWKMVSERTGQPIDENLWEDIAPIRHFSTWPANIAAKAAFLQSEDVGFRFLRRLRRAALTERKIISDPKIYEPLAKEIEGLDFDRFKKDIEDGTAEKAFMDDQEICVQWQTFGFPTMLFYKADADVNHLNQGNAVYVGGHRTMETYEQVIHALCPSIKKYPVRSEEELVKEYGPLTERELGQIHNRSKEEELDVLTNLEKDGTVQRTVRTRGNLWSAA